MNTDPQSMTLGECQQWLAKADGWEFKHGSWWHPDKPGMFIPFTSTLDGAAAALPDGWQLADIHRYYEGGGLEWGSSALNAIHNASKCVRAFGPDEITARYRLAVSCRLADREGKQ